MAQYERFIDDQELENLQRLLPWSPEPPLRYAQPRLKQTYMSHTEIAAALGISQQAVSMAEKRALQKCLRWCKARGIDLEDLLSLR